MTPAENPYYDRILRQAGNPGILEKMKVFYLIQQVRQSHYEFIRNGTEYDSSTAAQHLMRKYSSVMKRIEKAEQFVMHIASESSMTGEPYMIKTLEGKYYPAKKIFMNELSRLESQIKTIHSHGHS